MSICVVDGGPCQCQPSEGCPCPGVAALHAKDSIRTREHNLLVAENRSQAAEIAALRAEVAGLREELEAARQVMRSVRVFVTGREKIKHPEGTEWFDSAVTAIDAALAARKGEA